MLWVVLVALMLLALLVALRPQPVLVELVETEATVFTQWIEEEGRTRLRQPYAVASPILGWLQRVEIEPGDRVEAGQTLFRLEPLPAPALDPRSREQARDAERAASARLQSAEAQLAALETAQRNSESEYQRYLRLYQQGTVSAEQLEQMEILRDRDDAALRGARYQVDVARFERDAAQAMLAVGDGERAAPDQPVLEVAAPISGVVTERRRCCEGPVQAGELIVELGDLGTLEIQSDVLSSDAVQLREGMAVRIRDWGGDGELAGEVRRVAPAGFKRVSALGVEEQRVPVWVRITEPRERWQRLGVGYRVELGFQVWQADEVIAVPASSLFREAGQWFVYRVQDGRAYRQAVTPGRRSGARQQIVEGLPAGQRIVRYPDDSLSDGVRVTAMH
jgi:HlyD family secretion protein